jgi:hypothetical protein
MQDQAWFPQRPRKRCQEEKEAAYLTCEQMRFAAELKHFLNNFQGLWSTNCPKREW